MEWISDALNTTAGVIGALAVILGAVAGIFRFTRKIYQRVTFIYDELRPNGGGSIRDAINRIEAQQVAFLHLTGKAYWLSDPDGRCKFASTRLAAIMGVAPNQVLGFGWVSSVAPEHRVPVRLEWESAVRDRREFHSEYAYVHPDGTRVQVKGHAIPVIHAQTEAMVGMIGWAEPEWEDGPSEPI